MNMKKIIAGVAASALAVSAMAITASAAGVVKSSLKNSMDDGSGNFQVALVKDGENLYNIDVTKIASIDVTISNNASGDEAWVGGALITQCDAASWNLIGQYTSGDEATEADKKWYGVKIGEATTLTIDTPDGFAADSTYVIVTIQSYCAEGIEVTVDNVVAKDASGNVLIDVAKGVEAETTTADETEPEGTDKADETAADTTTGAAGNTNKPTNDKNNADTGIEGVAIVAGLAVLAAGAVVVAKKRK